MLSAVILCGGKGTRMGSLTKSLPKSLLEVNQKPILWYIIAGLYSHGIRHFVLPTGFKSDLIEKYVSNLRFKDTEFSCIYTGEEEAIGSRISQIQEHIDSENFLIINGDCLADFDLKNLVNTHSNSDNLVTILSCKITSPYGLFETDGSKVISFVKEQKINSLALVEPLGLKREFYIYSGISCLSKESLKLIDLNQTKEFEIDLFNKAAHLKRVGYLEHSEFWFAVETPKDLELIKHNFPLKKTDLSFNV